MGNNKKKVEAEKPEKPYESIKLATPVINRLRAYNQKTRIPMNAIAEEAINAHLDKLEKKK